MDLTMDSKKRSSTAEGGIPLWSAAPDYRKLLTYFFRKHSPGMVPKVDKLLDSYRGKEAKLMLMLAKKHDCSNPLNRIFVDRAPAGLGDGGGDRDRDYLALTTLYLSVFYPQDVDQAAALCKAYEGEEEEMFAKLSQNFHAINPLKMKKRSDEPTAWSRPVDYKRVLTGFYAEHDAGRVADVDQVLTKCKGREATLFSVFALKYDTENALNAVFEDRLKDTECADHVALLKLYLFIYHPSCMPDAKLMLSKYQGKEEASRFVQPSFFRHRACSRR